MYTDSEKERLTKTVTFSSHDSGKDIVKELKENWVLFIAKASAKSKSHTSASRYWNKVNKTLLIVLVLLGVVDTFISLLPDVPPAVCAGVAALFTLVACILAFLRPAERRQIHIRTSYAFQSLMLRMVRCKTNYEYDELWQDLNKTIFEEPYLRRRHIYKIETSDNEWTMTQELSQMILKKKEEVKRLAKTWVNRCVGTTTDMVNVEPNFYLNQPGRNQRPLNFQFGENSRNTANTPNYYAIEGQYDGRRRNGMNNQIVPGNTQPQDEAFELLVSEHSSQGIAIWNEGGQPKKKQTFQQLKRSQTTLN